MAYKLIVFLLSSAPELIGLLSELNATIEELERKVNPLLRKVLLFFSFVNSIFK